MLLSVAVITTEGCWQFYNIDERTCIHSTEWRSHWKYGMYKYLHVFSRTSNYNAWM